MTNKEVINFLNQVRKILLNDKSWLESTTQPINEAFDMAISALEKQYLMVIEDEVEGASCENCIHGDDCEDICILRQCRHAIAELKECYKPKPYTKSEPLTDNEQRIFLSAMSREEEVCKNIDSEYTKESYKDTLTWMCKEIKRKVKGVLWN